jgi:hypothetical protein
MLLNLEPQAAEKPFAALVCIRARVYACRKSFQLTRASAPELKQHEHKTFPQPLQPPGYCFAG